MIIVRIWEGLGNQMFQYAYARALKEKGRNVYIDLGRAYDEVFTKNKKSMKRDNVIQNLKITLPEIDVERYGKYNYLRQKNIISKITYWMNAHSIAKYKFYEAKDNEYSDAVAALNGNYYVKGWFQNEKYFNNIRGILEKEFTPRQKIKISPQLKLAIEDEESVSVHVRRSDYARMNNLLSEEYYYRAIEYIKKKYKDPIFLVFSDDLEWAKRKIDVDTKLIFVNENGMLRDYEELFLMSRCKSNIIANSTFSWWAGWLNRNKRKYVIAPEKWFPSQSQIVPADWIII